MYRSLLMHPQLSAAVIEASPAALVEQGLLCEHVDCVFVAQSTLGEAGLSSTVAASLKLISHLLEIGGRVVVVRNAEASKALTDDELVAQASKSLNIEALRISVSNQIQIPSAV